MPGLWRSPGEGKGYPLQENSMDYTVHGVTKSWTRLSDFHLGTKRKRILAYIYFKSSSWPDSSHSKESAWNSGNLDSIPGVGRSPGEGYGNPLQDPCLENPHGQRSLVGYSLWGSKELDKTERLNTPGPINSMLILFLRRAVTEMFTKCEFRYSTSSLRTSVSSSLKWDIISANFIGFLGN